MHMLGRRGRWIRPLANRYIKAFSGTTHLQRGNVIQFLRQDIGFQRACLSIPQKLKIQHWPLAGYVMHPGAVTRSWKVPKIESAADLANWLGTDIGYLEWFADLKGLGYKTDRAKLRHYHYRVLRKDSGDIRLIEAPKQALKKMQQQILGGILDKVPAHLATHGFVRGRSIKTFVAPHTGQRVVFRIDLRNFFPTFRAARIRGFFRTLGYPESVANLLAGICTTATPRNVWERVPKGPDLIRFWEMRAMYARSHLPQGAPTSPPSRTCALTGWIAVWLDLQPLLEPGTRGMPMTLLFPAMPHSNFPWNGFQSTRLPLLEKRASRSTIARRGSCGKACASVSPAS